MARISKRSVDGLQSHPKRETFIWDSDLKGFGVRAKPTGVKAYVIQYRTLDGITKRLTLGKIGTMTPEEARQIARAKLADIVKGADPSAEKKARREGQTVNQICDWYLEQAEAGRLLGRKGQAIKATTLAMDRSRIDKHVRPLLGHRKADQLTLNDIENFQADIANGKTKQKREKKGGVTSGGTGVAGRTTGMLHTIFAHALRRRIIAVNPAAGVRKMGGDNKRERRLSLKEIAALGKAMKIARQEQQNDVPLNAIKLLLLTGFRKMEGLALEWPWVELEERCVRFPDTKSGPQVRVLGSAAIELLKKQKRGESDFVFPSPVGEGHFIGLTKVLESICGIAKLKDVTPHVLRHTFGSVAGDLGFSELVIAALLGHSARGVTQRYVHLDKSLVLAADTVSNEIAEALG